MLQIGYSIILCLTREFVWLLQKLIQFWLDTRKHVSLDRLPADRTRPVRAATRVRTEVPELFQQNDRYVNIQELGKLQSTYDGFLLIVFIGERCRLQCPDAFGHDGFGDSLGRIVLCVLAVFSEIVSFTSVTSGGV